MLRPPGGPARAPSPAAPGSVIAGPGMQAGLAPLAWRDGRGPAVISARSMSARLGSAAPRRPETAMRDVLARLLPELALPAAEPSS